MEGQNGSTPKPRSIHSYEDLDVFQRSMRLLRPIAALVPTFPDYEKFALADQMRRASRSVPTNIAEGYAKKAWVKNFKSYLATSMGSAAEMVVHLKIARELSYIADADCKRLIEEYDVIGRQLNRLMASWRTFPGNPTSNFELRQDSR